MPEKSLIIALVSAMSGIAGAIIGAGLEKHINKKKILVVDDNPGDLVLICEMLEGHDVTTESNVSDALTRLQGESFDLIITDLSFPEGIDFNYIGAFVEYANVVAVSGLYNERILSSVEKRGALGLVDKLDLSTLNGYVELRNATG